MAILYTQQSKKIILALFLVFVFSIIFLPAISFAEEKINNFDAQIKINSDASILITETIKYDFGNTERHGIFRDIPVNYKTSAGNRSIDLELQSVIRDGQAENYEVSKSGSNISVKIGKADYLIKGEHTYVIFYKIKGAINYFKDLDEFYWNVTGNNWPAIIKNTSASVKLPETDISKIDISCYEGALGSNEKCITKVENNLFIAKASRLLQSGEGLTLAIDFPKGVVYEPTKLENLINLIKDNSILFLPFLVFIIMFLIWKKYGKDPKGLSTIIALYEPPSNMKPTLVGSLVDEKPDYRDITAGLIYLAEQGFIKIKRLEKEWFLGNVDYEIELVKNDITGLEKTEQSILKLFFEDSLVIGAIKKTSSFKTDINFSAKVKKIISNLYQEMTDKGFFVKNPMKTKISYIILSVVFVFLGLVFFSGLSGSVGAISSIISGIIILIFGMKMSKKTKLGAETKDEILGFKEFLSVTEKDRLNFHNAPEKNPEQFMEFLPYAIAFGVEKKWAKQFENIYIPQPNWYHSNVMGSFLAINFVSHMSSFSQSVNSGLAFSSKGAAGGGFGGGGGGFSGGGFGGGGGGSW
jgi:uncharacterized membrane protein